MKLFIFFVHESQFPALQKVCPNGFGGMGYKEFARRVDEGVAAFRRQGVECVRVYVDVGDFSAWCRASGVEPDNPAVRARYATERAVNPMA